MASASASQLAVAWSEGSDAEEDGDKQAVKRMRNTPISVGKQGPGGATAAHCLTLYLPTVLRKAPLLPCPRKVLL